MDTDTSPVSLEAKDEKLDSSESDDDRDDEQPRKKLKSVLEEKTEAQQITPKTELTAPSPDHLSKKETSPEESRDQT